MPPPIYQPRPEWWHLAAVIGTALICATFFLAPFTLRLLVFHGGWALSGFAMGGGLFGRPGLGTIVSVILGLLVGANLDLIVIDPDNYPN